MHTLTLTDIADRLSVPPTTVRHWAKIFSDYLKPFKPQNRRFPLYCEDDYTILNTVKKHYEDGKSSEAIRQLLINEYGNVVVQPTDDNKSTNHQQQQLPSLDGSPITTIARQRDDWQDWIAHQRTLTDSYKRQSREQNQLIIELETKTKAQADQLEAMTQEREALREKLAEIENQARSQKTPPNPQTKPTSRKRRPKPKTTPPEPQEKPKRGILSRIFS